MQQTRRDALKALCLLPIVGIMPAALPAVPIGEAVINMELIGVPRMQPVYEALQCQQVKQICQSLGIPYRVFISPKD